MSAISTPCVDLCKIEPVAGLCAGCGRTLAEIANWSQLSEDERLTVMRALPARMARLERAVEEVPGEP